MKCLSKKFVFIKLSLQKYSYKILFFGNDDVSLNCLKVIHSEKTRLDSNLIETIDVVTTPLESKKSPQKGFHDFVEKEKIKKYYLNPKNLKESWKNFYPEFDKEKYNIGIVASFGSMIPSKLIDKFEKGCYVMHPSMLPKYRGACPIQYALLNNDKFTGVSIIEASKKAYDKGGIIKQSEIEIKENFRFKELSEILSKKGGEDVVEFLKNYDTFVKNKKEQIVDPSDKSQLAPLITERNFVYLDFANMNSQEILTLYKAFFGSQLEPFTKITLNKEERMLFFADLSFPSEKDLEVVKSVENMANKGGIYYDIKLDNSKIFIKTLDGWLCSRVIKIDRKNYLPAEQFVTEVLKNQRFDKTKKNLAFICHNK